MTEDNKLPTATMVLVVEDDFFIALQLESTLLEAGYEVLGPASTVPDALHLLTAHRPAAAVLDVNLGSERVTPVAEVLATRRIPYLIASAYNVRDLENDPILAKAVNVGKPTSPKRLLHEMARILAEPTGHLATRP